MAIPHDPPGVMASVYVNGERIQEHAANDTKTKGLAEEYLEAKDGVEFEIWIRLADEVEFRGDVLGFFIIVDGNTMDQVFVTKKFVKEGRPLVRQGRVSSKGKMMKYSFKTFETTESQGSDYQRLRVAGLGSIVIEIHHMRRGAKTPNQFIADNNIGRGDELEVMPEGLIKGSGVSHSVSYSEAAPLKEKECATRRVKYVDPNKRPAGKIIFHYRSLEALMAMGVISKQRTCQNESLEDDALQVRRLTAGYDLEDPNKATAPSTQKLGADKEAIQPRRRKRPSDEEFHIDLDDDGNVVREYVVKKPKPSGEIIDLT